MAGLETNSEYSETAQAVSLGLAVLRKCKQNSWEELVAAMAADDVTVIKAFQALDLDEDQLELMGRRQREIGLVRITPAVVPAICPACEMFILTSDAAPAKCQVTAGCEGKPAKVAAAKATKAAPKPVEAPSAVPASETRPAPDDDYAPDDSFEEPAAADDGGSAALVSVSLEDLAEDFTDEPAPARSLIPQDDNDFD